MLGDGDPVKNWGEEVSRDDLDRLREEWSVMWGSGTLGAHVDNTESNCPVSPLALDAHLLYAYTWAPCRNRTVPAWWRSDGSIRYPCRNGRALLAPEADRAHEHTTRTRGDIHLDGVLEVQPVRHGVLDAEYTDGRDYVLLECPHARAQNDSVSPTLLTRVWPRVEVKERCAERRRGAATQERFSQIVVVTMDAVSQPNFYRQMPATAAVLKKHMKRARDGDDDDKNNAADAVHDVYEFLRANVGSSGTARNLVRLYSGISINNNFPARGHQEHGYWLWNWAREHGYATLWTTDECRPAWMSDWMGAPATDHLFSLPFCHEEWKGKDYTGVFGGCPFSQSMSNITYDAMRSMRRAYADEGVFMAAHLVDGHHENNANANFVDNDTARYLDEVLSDPNALLLFSADHGQQYGSFYNTKSGNLEARWVPLFLALPRWVRTRHPHIHAGLAANVQKLTTHVDTYRTLSALIALPDESMFWEPFTDHDDVAEQVTTRAPGLSSGVVDRFGHPAMYRLWDDTLPNRGCAEIPVDSQFCMCSRWRTSNDTALAEEMAEHAVDGMNAYVRAHADHALCERLAVASVLGMDEAHSKVQVRGDPTAMVRGDEDIYAHTTEYRVSFVVANEAHEYVAVVEARRQPGDKRATIAFVVADRITRYGDEPCHTLDHYPDKPFRNYCVCKQK